MISIIKLVFKSLPLVLLLTITLALHFSNITPFQRGFFCDDHNLKYPYIESETVPKYICLLIWFVISIFTTITTQILLNSKLGILDQFKQLFTGVLGCILFTDLAKYSVGRLRPHFLTLCNPDYNNVCFTEDAYYNVSDEQFLNEFYQKYVNETEVCTGESNQLKEGRLSFISGHASFSFYCATFLISYINTQTKKLKWGSTVAPYLQFVLALLATWISFTRIGDYYHHPSDVICGTLAGVGFALYFSGVNKIKASKSIQLAEIVRTEDN